MLSEEYFYKFVDIKDLDLGDKHQFVLDAETCVLPWNSSRSKLEKALWLESKKG